MDGWTESMKTKANLTLLLVHKRKRVTQIAYLCKATITLPSVSHPQIATSNEVRKRAFWVSALKTLAFTHHHPSF